MIKVRGLCKSFGEQDVLKDIGLDVQEGEIVVIVGQSGSSKSVLLQHLIGIFRPDRGTVEVGGRDITRLAEKDLLAVRRNIGYLFQEGALYDFMTVAENVAFPLEEHTALSKGDIGAKVAKTLEMVGLEEAAAKYPEELSGGMKKRAALARSIVLDSRILLCDEPTSGLDPIMSRDITDLIRDIARKLCCTTVVTSHDIPNAFRIADRVVLIRDGEVVAQGQPRDLMASRDPFIGEFLSCSSA
ncbi:MAG: ABC transporter ATP-binding protein [Candidatus Omnitrophota bacterium]|nr:ABC transporter ATP-binding protein [Candidatus Omnitrophota bacterium]MDZ4241474.1 ABC transporter ATP-binding protein [Candidatus Omnitrophota bacterium]